MVLCYVPACESRARFSVNVFTDASPGRGTVGRLIESHFPNDLAVLTVSLCFLQHFIGKRNYRTHFAWHSALVWLISVQLPYPYWCSSPELNISVQHATPLTFSTSGHISTSVTEFLSSCVPATRTFNALKHEMTRSPLLMSSPRKPCLILQNDLSSFYFWLAYLCIAYCLADSHCVSPVIQRRIYPHIPFDLCCSRLLYIIDVRIWSCLVYAPVLLL